MEVSCIDGGADISAAVAAQVTDSELKLAESQLDEMRSAHARLQGEHEQIQSSLRRSEARMAELEDALASAKSAAEHADEARVLAESARADLALRVDRQAELMEKQVQAAKAAAAAAARTHAGELAALRHLSEADVAAAAAKVDELSGIADTLRAQLARESRERLALEMEVGKAAAMAAETARGRGSRSVSGDEVLRSQLEQSRSQLEEATMRAERLDGELKQEIGSSASRTLACESSRLNKARAEAARLRARADGAERALEREQIKRTRAVSAANAERDAMREQMASRGKMADSALAEVAKAEQRLERERQTVEHYARQQEARALAQKAEAEKMLHEALEAAAGLQEMLIAQQRLAESYRAHAMECSQRLQQLSNEEGVVQTLRAQMAKAVEAVQMMQAENEARELQSEDVIANLRRSLDVSRAQSEQSLRLGLDSLRVEMMAESMAHEEDVYRQLQEAAMHVPASCQG